MRVDRISGKEEGRPVKVARFPWGASGRAATLGRVDGVTKLVIDPESERVLGVGIVGAGAGGTDRGGRACRRDGGRRFRPRIEHARPPDALGSPDGIRRSLLRTEHPFLSTGAAWNRTYRTL